MHAFCFRVCFGFDIDFDALNICQHNVEEFEIDNIELVQLDVRKWAKVDNHHFVQKFDTVIMNPPFGTRQQGKLSSFIKLTTYFLVKIFKF